MVSLRAHDEADRDRRKQLPQDHRARAFRARYETIQKLESGDLISRVVTDCRFAASNSELLIDGLRNVLIPVMLIARHVLGGLAGGAWVTWLPLIPVVLYPQLTKNSLSEIPAYRNAFAAMNGQAKDLVQNRTTVKAYRLQKKADQWMGEAVEDYRKKGVRGIGKIYTSNIPALAINVLPLFGCAIVGACLLYRGQFSADGFVTAVMLASVATERTFEAPQRYGQLPFGRGGGGPAV